eukprot:TRINITY_DN29505_c0_g1_i7.p1 TRINITY_DN29505_c0_g1~~TRINITY_DN29505_c0_g1_i7.p1  ORF type:complete len:315 (+),score=33.31 TRINITY_DN29505_c0_g1_i7:1-945(+)
MMPFEFVSREYEESVAFFTDRWHQQRYDTNQMVPPVPHHSCVVHISHKYKFIYVGIPKTGYKTTTELFRKQVCNGETKGCFENILTLKLTRQQYAKYLNEYFTFTFVRNPYNRAASAYFMMSKHFLKNPKLQKCAPEFQNFCRDPYKLKEMCDVYTQQKWQKQVQNYQNISNNNYDNDNNNHDEDLPCCCIVNDLLYQDFLDQHFMPQAPCVFDNNGNSMVDFVGRLEFYEEDLGVILSELNRRYNQRIPVPEKIKAVGIRFPADTELGNCSYVPNQSYLDLYGQYQHCLQSIRKYYQLDFEQKKKITVVSIQQ